MNQFKLRPEERACGKLLQEHLLAQHQRVVVSEGDDPPDLKIVVDSETWGVEVAGLVPVRSIGSEVLPEFAFVARSQRLLSELHAMCAPDCIGTYQLDTDGELSQLDCEQVLSQGMAFIESQSPGKVHLLPGWRATLESVRADGGLKVFGVPVHGSNDIHLDQRSTIASELDDKLPKLKHLKQRYAKVGICFWTDNSWHEEAELRGALKPHLRRLTDIDFIFVAISIGWHDANLVSIYP